ncbi:MAG: hypothetical protein KKH04_07605 [Proteobacteria bacterium]|nr:hypothetical protein [Pseudomonadota bacterium]
MGTPKGFSDRIENWLAKIPGIRTYQDREHRRETAKPGPGLKDARCSSRNRSSFTCHSPRLIFF